MSGDRRLFEAPPRTTRETRRQLRSSDARASKTPDQKQSGRVGRRPTRRKHVGRPAPVRGPASNNPRNAKATEKLRRAGLEVARPKTERKHVGRPASVRGPASNNPRNAKATEKLRRAGLEVARPKTERKHVGRPASVRGPASNNPRNAKATEKLRRAGLEVARPSTLPDHKHSARRTCPGWPRTSPNGLPLPDLLHGRCGPKLTKQEATRQPGRYPPKRERSPSVTNVNCR
jgi:hypothetical protein